MKRADGRIEKGQRLSAAISARAWNRAQDAADIVLGARPSVLAGDGRRLPVGCVDMLLQSTETVKPINAFEVVEITGVANQLADKPLLGTGVKAFESVPVLTGRRPLDVDRQNYCVALHQISAGQIGSVAVAGVVPCMVNTQKSGITNSTPLSHTFAIARPNVPYLVSAPTGSSRILYGITAGLAMVHLHSGVDYLLAVSTGIWEINTKSQCRLITSITLEDGGVSFTSSSGPLVDVWNFLGRVQPGEICVVSRCQSDKLILIQARGFAPNNFDQRVSSLSFAVGSLQSRVSALENT